MTARRDSRRVVRLLDVGARQTVSGDGTITSRPTVHCPVRETAVSVAQCLGCADCDGLVDGEAGDAIVCRGSDEPPHDRWVAGLRAGAVPLVDIMTRDVMCVREDVSGESLAALLVDLGISGAPVVDAWGRVVGVVSKSDLVQHELGQAGLPVDDPAPLDVAGVHPLADVRVRELMMPLGFCLPENASVARAAALMAYEGVHRVPVVAPDGGVVGIVSALDVLAWVAESEGYALGSRRGR